VATELKLSIGKSGDISCFWNMVGRYIANRDVIKELGINIYDDKNVIWFVSHVGARLVGFCCLEAHKTSVKLTHEFVNWGYRGNGYYSKLFLARDDYIKRHHRNKLQKIRTKNPLIIKKAQSFGFVNHWEIGSYTELRRGVNEKNT